MHYITQGDTFINFLCLEHSERNGTFDEQIFNALVEKIDILTPTHFVFELKNGMRVEEQWSNIHVLSLSLSTRPLF